MSFKLGDSLGDRRCLVLFLQLRGLFLKLGHLFLKQVGLLVLLFGFRYFSSPTLLRVLWSTSLDHTSN